MGYLLLIECYGFESHPVGKSAGSLIGKALMSILTTYPVFNLIHLSGRFVSLIASGAVGRRFESYQPHHMGL